MIFHHVHSVEVGSHLEQALQGASYLHHQRPPPTILHAMGYNNNNNNNNNNNTIYRRSPTRQGGFQWGPHKQNRWRTYIVVKWENTNSLIICRLFSGGSRGGTRGGGATPFVWDRPPIWRPQAKIPMTFLFSQLHFHNVTSHVLFYGGHLVMHSKRCTVQNQGITLNSGFLDAGGS